MIKMMKMNQMKIIDFLKKINILIKLRVTIFL